MGKKIPEDYMGGKYDLPKIPPNGWAEDYRDDWISLVARRLSHQISGLSAPQRKALAALAYTRAFRKEMTPCKVCHGNGWYLTQNDGDNVRCEMCHGAGQVASPTARYIGRDARNRPVVEYKERGDWRRHAVGREGQPVDVAEPVKEEKFTWRRAA